MSNDSNRIWLLMSRSLNGEASTADQAELEQLLAADAGLQQQYATMRALWRSTTSQAATDKEVNVSRILQLARVEEAVAVAEDVPVKLGWFTFRRMAAITAAASIIALFLYKYTASETVQLIVAQNGSRMQSKLPDGSTVWLNAGSTLSYRADFEGPVREVTLTGEAYFDVAKNARKPFIVNTAGIHIKVLGTAFNVRAYATDKAVETTLINGLVQVTREENSKQPAIYLHPDEKLVIARTPVNASHNAHAKSTALTNSSEEEGEWQLAAPTILHLDSKQHNAAELAETAWMYNRLVFNGDSFGELAPKLERWYNIHIQFTSEALKNLRFNGSFENETPEQAFTALATAVPFHFHIEGRTVQVSAGE